MLTMDTVASESNSVSSPGSVAEAILPESDAPPVSAKSNHLAPGLVLAALGSGLAYVLGGLAPSVSALTVAVILGAFWTNVVASQRRFAEAATRTQPGLTFAAKKLLRVGIVLLGLRLSAEQVLGLGAPTLVVVSLTVGATFFGTQFLGRRMGLSPALSLLVATGYSICGASAIAAVEGSTDAEEEEVAMAIGLVTLFGTIAMVVLPPMAGVLSLDDQAFGTWAGASIHDVAQVVAAGSQGGSAVLAVAVVVKLCRVVMLAPVVAGVNIARRRQLLARQAAVGTAERVVGDQSPLGSGSTPALVPGFVLGFLAMMALRTSGVVPDSVIDAVKFIEGLLFGAALIGLGAGVKLARFRELGPRPFLLGLVAWVVVAVASLAAITVLL